MSPAPPTSSVAAVETAVAEGGATTPDGEAAPPPGATSPDGHDLVRGPVPDLLDALASPTPDPGGGSAAAMMLGLAAALAQMVVGYSPAVREVDPGLPDRVAVSRADAVVLVGGDGAASAGFARALGLPHSTSAERTARGDALVAASLVAAESALAVAEAGGALLADLRLLDRHAEPRVHADVRVAAAAVGAVLRAGVATAQESLQYAQSAGATAAACVTPLRRIAAASDQIDIADTLASRWPARPHPG